MSVGTLYVVATPLGNLGDLSDRAKQVLRDADIVAAEDTRRARILLKHATAKPRVVSFHTHSPANRIDALLDALVSGKTVALLTDAGTPTISDPGSDLVARAHEHNARVLAVPGPSAVAAALSVSGFPADRYLFLGFLPRKGKERGRLLTHVTASKWTTAIFESPHRLVALLEDLADHCGAGRAAAVARELTKVHEEVKSGTLNELAGYYREHPPRGEVTVLVSADPTESEVDRSSAPERARAWLERGLSRRDAADRVAEEFQMSRREAYRIVNEL